MTTIAPILTGVAAHIGTYADAVALSDGGNAVKPTNAPCIANWASNVGLNNPVAITRVNRQ